MNLRKPQPRPKKKPAKKARKVKKPTTWRNRAIKLVPGDVGLINDN